MITGLSSSRRVRAMSMLEIVISMAILTMAVMLFGSGMIVATRAESKAAEHTQAIMIGNYLLEQVRRDQSFWDSSGTGDYDPSCPGGDCWHAMSPSNQDNAGNVLPPYDDNMSTPPSGSNWHAGFVPAGAPALVLPPYHYVWRADPIDRTKFTGSNAVAAITIQLYVDQEGTQDVYVTKGMNRAP
jgi:type II secretory pathway pseudopilin PulG